MERWPTRSKEAREQLVQDALEKKRQEGVAPTQADPVVEEWKDFIRKEIDDESESIYRDLNEFSKTAGKALNVVEDELRAAIKDLGNQLRQEMHTAIRANLNKLI